MLAHAGSRPGLLCREHGGNPAFPALVSVEGPRWRRAGLRGNEATNRASRGRRPLGATPSVGRPWVRLPPTARGRRRGRSRGGPRRTGSPGPCSPGQSLQTPALTSPWVVSDVGDSRRPGMSTIPGREPTLFIISVPLPLSGAVTRLLVPVWVSPVSQMSPRGERTRPSLWGGRVLGPEKCRRGRIGGSQAVWTLRREL